MLKLLDKRIFIPSPKEGTTVTGGTFYSKPTGTDLVNVYSYSSRSDIMDTEYRRISKDNGQTWTEPIEIDARIEKEDEVLQRHIRGGICDPRNEKFFLFRNEARLPNGLVSEYLRYNTIYYSISDDGGKSFYIDKKLVQDEDEYDENHPLPGVYWSRNSYMLGDKTCLPIITSAGSILLPCQISPIGPSGVYENPGGGYTYGNTGIIEGKWKGDDISWSLKNVIEGDPDCSTRGLLEPTLAELSPGRFLIVMRGSNDSRPDLKGYRWFSISEDGGESWSTAAPWRYTSGEGFFSPSSCSQLLSHSSGKLFWLGNINDANPRGNLPRYPFYIGEVERKSGFLIRDTLFKMDDRKSDDPEFLTISNFSAREDRETGHIIVTLPRTGRPRGEEKMPFRGDNIWYEIEV
jgi:hypothetical protein